MRGGTPDRAGHRTAGRGGAGTDVDVVIGELALFGLPASARYAVADALQAELARLLTQAGATAWAAGSGHDSGDPRGDGDGHLDHLDLTVALPPSAGGTGRAVARAVHDGLVPGGDR